MGHFCMTMNFSKHEHNSKLPYPDHSRYHNVNLHCNLQVFLYVKYINMKLKFCCIIYFVWEKVLLICMISDKNPVVHPNISSQIYIFTVFLVHLAVQFLRGVCDWMLSCQWIGFETFWFRHEILMFDIKTDDEYFND